LEEQKAKSVGKDGSEKGGWEGYTNLQTEQHKERKRTYEGKKEDV
jgi:hypothetical protein